MQRPSAQRLFPLSQDGQEFLVAQHCAALSRRANGLRIMSILVSVLLLGTALLLTDRVQTGRFEVAFTSWHIVLFLGTGLMVALVPHVLLAQAVGADRAWVDLLERSGLAVRRDSFGHPVLASTRSRPWYSLSAPVLVSDYLLTLLPPLSFVLGVTYTSSLAGGPPGWPVVSFVTIAVVIMLVSWVNVVWVIRQCHGRLATGERAGTVQDNVAPPAEHPPAQWGRRASDRASGPPVPDASCEPVDQSIQSLYAQQPWPDAPPAAPDQQVAEVAGPAQETVESHLRGTLFRATAQDADETCAPAPRQTMTRESLPGGIEVVRGTCSLVIPAGRQLAVQHIGFVPALPSAPEIRCQVLNGRPVTIHVAKCYAYGARIEVRSSQPVAEDTEASFRFEAVCAE